MNNPERILRMLDKHLTCSVELTLYGRAALALGFPKPQEEYAWSRDVDAVLWLGQAEELDASGNFWDALDLLNAELEPEGLYMTHLFDEDQVILRPNWRDLKVPVNLDVQNLRLYRLSDLDLFLSKLMRNDPIDAADAQFIIESGKLEQTQVCEAIAAARVPDIPEIREQFEICSQRYCC